MEFFESIEKPDEDESDTPEDAEPIQSPLWDPQYDESATSSAVLDPEHNFPRRKEDVRSYLPTGGPLSSSNAFDPKTSNQKLDKNSDQMKFKKARNSWHEDASGIASYDNMSSIASSSDKSLMFQPKYKELDFPGVEYEQLVKELRDIYMENKEQFANFKNSYLDTSNAVFQDFVKEFIFILRNTFEIPDDSERLQLMMEEVLSAPVLFQEYEKLIEEVSSKRFLWGLNDYGGMDLNGDGQITLDEIESKVGKSKKKMTKLMSKERTKDDHISLTEFLMCWDHAGKKSKKGKDGGKGGSGGGRKNKAFKHEKKYDASHFPGVTLDDIADELREAYANNQQVLECYKEEYTHKDNLLFADFVQELLFVKRNISNVIPADEEQFLRLLLKLLQKPIEYSEYCSVLSQLPVNKFGWGIDGFAKLDLDNNGSISPEEIESAFGKSKKKREKLEALEKNNDGKISLAEFLHCWEHEPRPRTVPYKVMIVLTNNADLGTTGRKTGFYLPEVAHPYHVFKESGLDVVFVSPRGGYSPMDPASYEAYMDDLICMNFIEDPKVLHQLDNTLNPANIDPRDISAVFYAGGHGPMWDVAFDKEIAEISRRVYVEFNGILGAVCHGTCGLLPISLKQATKPSLLENKKVTCFTNQEEEMIFNDEAWEIMNFKLETKLEEKGAKFQRGEPFACNVVNHNGVITGQNPQSATKCAQIMVEELAAKIADKNAFNKLI